MISYNQVIEQCAGVKPHLLLGNGFSIGCHSGFNYETLLADPKSLTSHSTLQDVLVILKNDDAVAYRKVITNPDLYRNIVPRRYRDLTEGELKDLRRILARATIRKHPKLHTTAGKAMFRQCSVWLSSFDKLFTTNYDLLLYWALLASANKAEAYDGFSHKGIAGDGGDTLKWSRNPYARVWFLHGGIHIWEWKGEIYKLAARGGTNLLDRIPVAVDRGYHPVCVLEGCSKSKLECITNNEYLLCASNVLSSLSGSLVIYGHALADFDYHILNCISESEVQKLFIGVHGGDDARLLLANNARHIQERRSQLRNEAGLSIEYFSSCTCPVWAPIGGGA